MAKQSNQSRTLKTTADPQEAGLEIIFWAIEDILELGLNRNEAAALRRIIAMGSQAFYESLGEQGSQLLARRRSGSRVRVPVAMTTKDAVPKSTDNAVSSFDAKANLTTALGAATSTKLDERASAALNTKAKEAIGQHSAEHAFKDMRGMAISRNAAIR